MFKMRNLLNLRRASYYFMTNILLVFTGGTIGSRLENGTIDTDETAGYKLVQLFQQQDANAAEVRFKTLQPLQILSENLHPNAWQPLIAAIEAEDLSAFDGIIVTHGTDTLAYTAAMLAMHFHGLPIPMLLVSSNFPLDNHKGNGLKNFLCAVEYVRQHQQPGVFVPYQNPGQAMHVHIAARLSSCLPMSDDFISVQNQPFMTFDNGEFEQNYPLPPIRPKTYQFDNRFAKILIVRPYPGLDYNDFKLDGVDAVLHDLYHSGTACVSQQWGAQHSLIAFSKQCRESGTPLYLTPIKRSESAYSSTRELQAQGTKMIWNTSLEASYAKLALAHAQFDDSKSIDTFLEQDIAWEQV